MISPGIVFHRLVERGVHFYAGVPDSLLQPFCSYVEEHARPGCHLIAANEGNALAIAMGHQLATGNVPAVYMQNSGLGNAINPLTSLADPQVYRVPILLIIGWRGEPGVKDEPQHVKQGKITADQLDLLGIPFNILDAESDALRIVDSALDDVNARGAPGALLVRHGAFAPFSPPNRSSRNATLTREEALQCLLDLAGDALVVVTTGKASREVFELRAQMGQAQTDFLTVGGMGHASSIALGVALGCRDRRVVCLDGDGALLMHMGALPIIGQHGPANLVHVLLNNAAHESVGGQPTVADALNFAAISLASGYRTFGKAHDLQSLRATWADALASQGPALLQVNISCGSRPDLGRPTTTPEENKRAFVRAIQ